MANPAKSEKLLLPLAGETNPGLLFLSGTKRFHRRKPLHRLRVCAGSKSVRCHKQALGRSKKWRNLNCKTVSQDEGAPKRRSDSTAEVGRFGPRGCTGTASSPRSFGHAGLIMAGGPLRPAFWAVFGAGGLLGLPRSPGPGETMGHSPAGPVSGKRHRPLPDWMGQPAGLRYAARGKPRRSGKTLEAGAVAKRQSPGLRGLCVKTATQTFFYGSIYGSRARQIRLCERRATIPPCCFIKPKVFGKRVRALEPGLASDRVSIEKRPLPAGFCADKISPRATFAVGPLYRLGKHISEGHETGGRGSGGQRTGLP